VNIKALILSSAAIAALGGYALAAPAVSPTTTAQNTTSSTTPSTPTDPNAPTPGTTTGSTGMSSTPNGVPLASVSEPAKTLKSASVESSDGTKVGKVTRVHLDSNGQPQTLDVRIGKKTVSLDASQANYDSSQKIVVASLSATDMKNLPKPGASSSSSTSPSTSSPNTYTPAQTAPSGADQPSSTPPQTDNGHQ
jgi:hypothetical protein